MHETIRKFGWPETLVREYEHWVVLLRPAQPTVGALILSAKSAALAFGNLPSEAHAELAPITRALESVLREMVAYQRINYLMLMMVDPHVHFHVLPRYEGERTLAGLTVADTGWPGPPVLSPAFSLGDGQRRELVAALAPHFR